MSAGAAIPVAPSAGTAAVPGMQGQAVAVVDASRIAMAAARAVLLEAIVQGRGGDGVVTLKTPQGDVQIRATTTLPTGAAVALELTRTGEQLNARLLPAAALRTSTAGAIAAPPSNATPVTSGNPAAVAGSSPVAPAVRSGTIGSATFGAIALASDPSQPPRASAAPTATPAAPAATELSSAQAASTSGRATAPPPPSAPPAAAAAAATTSGTAAPATPATGPGAAREAPLAARSPPASAQGAPAGPASTSPSSSASAQISGAPGAPSLADVPLSARAAAVAVYTQARAAAPARPTTTTAVQGIAPTGATQAASPSPTGRATASITPAQSQSAPGASSAPQRLLPGTTLEVRLAAAAPQASGSGMRAAQPLPATVVGAMPQGRLVVDTPVGRLAVSVPPDLLGTPPGRMLQLEWLPETTRAPLSGDDGAGSNHSTRAWPQAREAAAAMLARPEQALREAAEQLVPKPGPRLAQQMMGFIGRGDGDVARWLGEAVMRQLEQTGLVELSGRAEGGAAREPDRQPGNGDWRHVTMPLFDGTMLRPIEIRARKRNGGEAEGGRDQSRFVVDCVHDELGAVQIDGLMTSASAKKRLDVILRSHVEIPEADRAALAALFADTCGAMGLGGEIAFQVLEHFPVVADNPLAHRAVIA